MSDHWSADWVGKQYPVNGCWLFVAEVYREVFGIDMDDFADFREPKIKAVRKIHSEMTQGPWLKQQEPEDGCGVALTMAHAITHIGVYADVDGGRVLHTMNNGQVVAVTTGWLSRYKWKYQFYQCLLKSQ